MIDPVTAYLTERLNDASLTLDYDDLCERLVDTYGESQPEPLMAVCDAFALINVSPTQVPRVIELVEGMVRYLLEVRVGEGSLWSGDAQEVLERANGDTFED